MPKAKKETPLETSPARSWQDRKEKYQNIQVFRDLAGMLKTIADDEGKSIAEIIDALTRPTAEGMVRTILERQLRELGGGTGKAQGTRRTG